MSVVKHEWSIGSERESFCSHCGMARSEADYHGFPEYCPPKSAYGRRKRLDLNRLDRVNRYASQRLLGRRAQMTLPGAETALAVPARKGKRRKAE